MYKIVAAIVALAIIVGGIFALTRKDNKNSNNNTQPATSQNQSSASTTSTESSSKPATKATVITYSDSGFSPSTVTVKSGDSVTVKNTSAQAIQFNSDPHPTHTDDPDLNVGTIEAGKSATFTVTQTGTFGYHNHLDPSQTGTIVIQ